MVGRDLEKAPEASHKIVSPGSRSESAQSNTRGLSPKSDMALQPSRRQPRLTPVRGMMRPRGRDGWEHCDIFCGDPGCSHRRLMIAAAITLRAPYGSPPRLPLLESFGLRG